MLVNDYRVFIQDVQPRKNQTITQRKKSQENFVLQEEHHISQPTAKNSFLLPVDYINTKNYFINKTKLQQKEKNLQKDPLDYYKKLSKLKKLPKSYSIPFTTFYDLSKPQHPLNKITVYKDNALYQEMQQKQTQNNMVATYIANDLYYKRTSA
jgi:hypothetical protein